MTIALLLALSSFQQPALAQEAPPIVNGDYTSDFPAVGMLVVYAEGQGGSNFCSGTLIHPSWVLTAAHCIDAADQYQRHGYQILFATGPSIMSAEEWIEADTLLEHPDYSTSTMSFDLGLMHLTQRMTSVEPMQVNREDIDGDWVGRDIQFVGFGTTTDSGAGSGYKRTAAIPLVHYDDYLFRAYDSSGEQNLCSGDSGGAGLRETADGEYTVAGVNSFVFAMQHDTGPCEAGASGSSRVDSGLAWIEQYVPLHEVGPVIVATETGNLDTGDPLTPAVHGIQPDPGGCSTAPAGFGWMLGALGLLIGWTRRQG